MAKKKDIEIEIYTAPKPLVPEINISKGNQKKLLLAASLVVLFAALAGAIYFFSGSLFPQPKVVATVNGEKILQKDYQSLLDAQKNFYDKVQKEQKVSTEFLAEIPKIVLDQMIREKLMSQYLKGKGITVTDQQVKDYVKKEVVDASYNGNWKDYEAFLVKSGFTLESALANSRIDFLMNKVIEIEKIKPIEFDGWYLKQKEKAKIEILEEDLK